MTTPRIQPTSAPAAGVLSSTPGSCRVIRLPRIDDVRGNLSFVEEKRHIPFAIKRVYWVYDVPGGATRDGHAYRTLEEFIIAVSGSFDVVIDDGKEEQVVQLNRSYVGLYVPPMVWRRLENFSSNSVALILASQPYSEGEYLREYQEFTFLGKTK
ncbi:MAG: FdtA/QdtA family cupin domain-containing protein [Terriglobia bacterium]|jgi:mannose-6-phosphate isomerase-like protein (cupin superfamily)